MPSAIHLTLAAALLFALPAPELAATAPSEIGIARLATFNQAVGAAPEATGAEFYARAGNSPVGLNWSVTPPLGGEVVIPPASDSPPPGQTGIDRVLSESYSDVFFFPISRPGGAYLVSSSGSIPSEFYLEVGGTLAASTSITNLAAAQDLISGTAFTLTWAPPAGATANDVLVLLVVDDASAQIVYQSPFPLAPGAIAGNATAHSFTVPPGTAFTGRLIWLRLSQGTPEEVPAFLADTRLWAGAGSRVSFPLRATAMTPAAALDHFLAEAGVAPGNRDPLADPDGDGLTHLEEWFWGTSPVLPDFAPLPVPTLANGLLTWILDVPARDPGPGLQFHFHPGTVSASPVPVTHEVLPNGPNRRLLRVQVPAAPADPAGFLSLRLSLP